MRITKQTLKRSSPQNVRRLAKSLGLHITDKMSDGQVIRLVAWLLSRREKRELGRLL